MSINKNITNREAKALLEPLIGREWTDGYTKRVYRLLGLNDQIRFGADVFDVTRSERVVMEPRVVYSELH